MEQEISIRKNHSLLLHAFDTLMELKRNGVPVTESVETVHNEVAIPIETLRKWYSGLCIPFGRRGEIAFLPELFYVLGALLGDGCVYRWKLTNNYVILVGDQVFAEKYAERLSRCTNLNAKAYIDRSKNIWFVRSNNFKLYSTFEKARKDAHYLESLIGSNGPQSALLFIEGFFDAEGCVKIVKEPIRKTPKICLDVTNTNFEYLELIRKLLKEKLNIEAKYSNQGAHLGKDGFERKKVYHLRIYKKEFVKRFFENIKTVKLKPEKIKYVEDWLNTKNKEKIISPAHFDNSLQLVSN